MTLVEHVEDKEKKKLVSMEVLPFEKHLPRLEETQEWNSYNFSDEYAIHYIIDATTGYLFICMAHQHMSRRIALSFLCHVQEAFNNFLSEYQKKHSFDVSKAKKHEFQSGRLDFKKKLKELVGDTRKQGYDKIANLHSKVRDVKDVLEKTMTDLMVREDRIRHMSQGIESLSQSASSFNRSSRSLHQHMRWQNIKVILCIVLVVLAALAAIVFFSCGFKLDKC